MYAPRGLRTHGDVLTDDDHICSIVVLRDRKRFAVPDLVAPLCPLEENTSTAHTLTHPEEGGRVALKGNKIFATALYEI